MPMIPEKDFPSRNIEKLSTDDRVVLRWSEEKVLLEDVRGDVGGAYVYEVKAGTYEGADKEVVEDFLKGGGRILGTDKGSFLGIRPNKSGLNFPSFLEEYEGEITETRNHIKIPGKILRIPSDRVRGSVHHFLKDRISAKGLYTKGKNDLGKFADLGGMVFETDRLGIVLVTPKDSKINFPPGYEVRRNTY